jgi:hypothetical protein
MTGKTRKAVGRHVTGQRIVLAIADEVDAGRGVDNGRVLDVGRQGVGAARAQREFDAVRSCRRRLGDGVGEDVKPVDVVTCSANQAVGAQAAIECVVAGVADQGVVAGQAAEAVVAGPAGQVVVEALSVAGEVADAGVAEVLDFGPERVAGEIGVDAVAAARGRFDDDVAGVGDEINVIAKPTNQAVVARATIQGVVAGQAAEAVVAGPPVRLLLRPCPLPVKSEPPV